MALNPLSDRPTRIWPWLAFWCLSGLLACFGIGIAEAVAPNEQESFGIYFGWIVAIFGILIILAGLSGKTPIEGLAKACMLAIGIFFLLIAPLVYALPRTAEFETLGQRAEIAIFAFLFPLLLMVAAGPLWLMRWFRGWRLARDPKNCSRDRWTVEHLFWATTLVACVIYFSRIPQLYFDLKPSQIAAFLPGLTGLFLACSLLVVAPTLFGLSTKSMGWTLWVWIVVSVALSTMLLLAIFKEIIRDWFALEADSINWMCFLYSACAAACLYPLGILALRESGFRLVLVLPATEQRKLIAPSGTPSIGMQDERELGSENRFSANETLEPDVALRSGRRWLAAFLLCGLLTTVMMSQVRLTRERQLESVIVIQKQLKGQGGDIRFVRDRQISNLQWPPGTIVDDLSRYGSLAQLRELSLSGCQIPEGVLLHLSGTFRVLRSLNLSDSNITDSGLEELVQSGVQLYRLDLSGTGITARGLESIKKLNRLRSLKLSRTRIATDAIAEYLAQNRRLRSVYLEDMELEDSDLSQLYQSHLLGWHLAGNRLTDVGLSTLWEKSPEVLSLDLSRNPIDGSLFGQVEPTNVFHLTIDDVPVNDATLKRFILSPQRGSNLSLNTSNLTLAIGRSQLTGRCLDWLMESACSKLKLLEGSFTDQDLTGQILNIQVQHLEVNCSQLSGKILSKFQTLPRYLSMRGSAFTDQDCKYLPRSRGQYVAIHLTGCQVTDKCLPYMEAIQPDILDLTGTQVTAAGLLKSDLPKTQVIISLDQFNAEDLAKLRSHLNLYDDILWIDDFND